MSEMLEVIGLVTIIWLGIILIIGLCFWVKDFILEHRLAYNKGYKDGLYGYYGCIGCVYPNSLSIRQVHKINLSPYAFLLIR